MRHWLLKIVAITALVSGFLAISPNAYAQNVQDFTIESFVADYRLSRAPDQSSKLDVTETIVAKFPDRDQNHGILRAIPERYQDHTLSLEILSVTNQVDTVYPYTTYSENGNLVLKIGDPDRYAHGLTTYIIHYTVKDVISFFEGHDEFFWDINGDQWAQPFKQVRASILIDKGLTGQSETQNACFVGYLGSRAHNCATNRFVHPEGIMMDFIADNLAPQQTMSVALKFKPGTFKLSPAVEREELLQNISLATGIAVLILLPISAAIFMYRRWREFGDDPKGRGIIIPHYEPPKGLDALSADFLVEQKLRPEAISAMLLQLAVGGYLTIYEIPKKGWFGSKDYELKLNKVPMHATPIAKNALTAIFGDLKTGTRVKLSEFRDDISKQQEMSKQTKKLDEDLAAVMHAHGYFNKNPKAVKNGYRIWSSIILFAGIAGSAIGFNFAIYAAVGLGFGLIFAALVILLFSHIMPARTQKGVDAYDQLLGLKHYIKIAEADRLKYLQSPEGAEKVTHPDKFDPKSNVAKIKLFEELLPFAMLFGLEKKWAQQFKDIYTDPPGWYHGNWTAFNAAYLGSSLSGFNGASGSSFTTPSSSGSGFGGGGAGGGGGGGGGGGW